MSTGFPYITKFQLKGYKSIKDVSGEFYPGLNIIIGDNGSGKSNLLKFVYWVLEKKYTGLDLFSADLTLLDDSEQKVQIRVEGKMKDDVTFSDSDIKIWGEDLYKPVNTELITFNIPEKIEMLSEECNPRYNISDGRLASGDLADDIHTLRTLKLWLRVGFTTSHLRRLNSLGALNEEQLYKSLQSHFDLSYYEIIDQIKKYTPIEEIRFSNSIRITKADSLAYEFRNLILEFKVNGEWFSWNALSDGTKRLLYILFSINDTVILIEDMGEMILLRPIALFEEPELGIHPHQLHLLLTLMKERAEKQQIIITTHSPQVLDVLGADDLHRVFITEIDPEKGTILRKMTEEEMGKARVYLKETGMLSDYWRFSDFQRSKMFM
jgi:predicted ATP-dependent endonuclease of OLD family